MKVVEVSTGPRPSAGAAKPRATDWYWYWYQPVACEELGRTAGGKWYASCSQFGANTNKGLHAYRFPLNI